MSTHKTSFQAEALEARTMMSVSVNEVEPNDGQSAATVAPLSPGEETILLGTAVDKHDRDFFRITPTAGGRVELVVEAAHGTAPQVEIESPASDDLFETEPEDGMNRGSFVVSAGTTLLLRVRSVDDAPSDYRVILSLQEEDGDGGNSNNGGGGSGDLSSVVAEQEVNDTEAQANPFRLSDSGTAQLTGVSTSVADPDYFVVTANQAGMLRVVVGSDGNNIPQLEVDDQHGEDRLETEPHDGINRGTFRVEAGQQLYFRLRSKNGLAASYVVDMQLLDSSTEIVHGDCNLDGNVDFSDFVQMANNYGRYYTSWEHGDFDGDKQVTFLDFVDLARNFGYRSHRS